MSVIESGWDRARTRRRVRNRKYGTSEHKRAKAQYRAVVEAGLASCARCGNPIVPGSRWHAGHDDFNPRLYHGPEHAECNERAPHLNVTSRQW